MTESTVSHRTFFRPEGETRRILLIEDEIINQEILKAYLSESYDIVIASSGSRAMEIIETGYETISLILLDLNLPDIHGLDVLKKVKSDVRFTRIPVIVMTADSDAEVECLTLGAIDFIPKPYPQQKVVLARVLRTIELSEDRDILRWTERDNLTGLYNKDFFYRHAMQLDIYHKDSPTDAIMVNINHFHSVNDRYGKTYGDRVLKHIGEKALEIVEEKGGIACRSEADNFLIYCPHRMDYKELLETLAFGMGEEDNAGSRIRLRMGVYSCVDKELEIERRFDRAKMAADKVKNNFTETIGIYDESMHETELLYEQLIEDFPAAVRDKQFEVHFQPKFNVQGETPAISSAEALVRWRHPELGMVSPGVFIPLFEKNGIIRTLDNYVWNAAAGHVKEWKEKYGFSLPVSVNVSRIDFYDPKLVENLLGIVERNALKKEEFILEITESAYTEDSEQIVDIIKKLRNEGFLIEMDDFGSGYSSLNMLSTLPIDALKLDMQFVRNAFKERKDTRLLETMIQLADSFGAISIAEGVETAEQVFTLKSMGCDIIQGYYFSRPLPPDEFEKFVLDNRPNETEPRRKEVRRRSDRFTYNAMHDSLTGLYNYSAFDILFRDSDRDHIAVLIAEIDGYDESRRSNGKEYADRMVCRVAESLKKNFRSVDHICRLKEDEFAVIMTRVTSRGKDLVSEKVEKLYKELQTGTENADPVALSVGIAFSDSERPGGDVFSDADTALNRLKNMNMTGYAVY